jgi:hypothetical protein
MANRIVLLHKSIIVVTTAIASTVFASATPTGTDFTYQGLFQQGGTPANGTHHLRFQLWDAPSGGAQVGGDVDQPALAVVDGLFTATLDFGTLAFNGEARWLQVQVITNGGSTVTTLSPRQRLNAAPYALFALNADGPNLTNLNASHLTDGTVPSAQLSGTYGNALELTNSANIFAGTFAGDGASLTGLSASHIASGTVAAARMPSGGDWLLTSALNVDANTFVVDPANDRIGIGTAAPAGPLHVRANVPHLLLQDTASAANQSGYIDFRNDTFVSTGWIGYGTPGSPDLSIVNARSGGDILLTTLGGGSVGIGTPTPAVALHVRKQGPVMVLQDTAINANQAGYVGFWNSSGTETGWMGYGSPGSPVLTILNSRAGGHISLLPASSAAVAVGTSVPNSSHKMHVVGSASSISSALFAENPTGSHGIIGECEAAGGYGVRGIGHTGVFGDGNSISGVGVRGEAEIGVYGSGGPVGVQGSGTNFDFYAVGSGTNYGSSSSIRWKRDIRSIADPLSMLERVRGVYYTWDADHGGEEDIGMIAEEVGKVLPEIVAYEANGIDAIGLDYSKMSPLLVEAVKALRAEKDAEIAQLNHRIDELERLLRTSFAARHR